jgi:hemerythrin-like domain-containing protein
MRLSKNLRADQENIRRFIDALGGAAVALGHSKRAKPGFFINAHSFIQGYIDVAFFKKEELLLKALEQGGFPPDEGPLGLMRTDQRKSHEAAVHLLKACKAWQAGDETIRTEVGWAASQYTSTMRQHLERLKNLVFPLLEQTISDEDEERLLEQLSQVVLEGETKDKPGKFSKLVEMLEDELSDWK